MKVYEVYRNTPLGDYSMAIYTTEAEAKKHQEAWNRRCHRYDQAKVVERVVLDKYPTESPDQVP